MGYKVRLVFKHGTRRTINTSNMYQAKKYAKLGRKDGALATIEKASPRKKSRTGLFKF